MKEEKSETLEDLEKVLDSRGQAPQDVEITSDTADRPPHPRDAGVTQPTAPSDKKDDVTDAVLQQAGDAAEQTATEDAALEPDRSLHTESRPKPKKRFYKRVSFWLAAIFIVLVAAALVWLIRPSRLYALQLVGLRTPVTITVTAAAEGQQPVLIKNAVVTIDGVPHATNDVGVLSTNLSYGYHTINTQKDGATISEDMLLDFDPFFHLLGGKEADQAARNIGLKLTINGQPVSFTAKSWLTGEPITSGTFTVGSIVAVPNELGVVSITLPVSNDTTATVKAVFNGAFVDKEFTVVLGQTLVAQEFSFVPGGRAHFIQQNAVFSSDLDGGNKALLIAASAADDSTMNFTASPGGRFGVLVSKREAKTDSHGERLQKIFIVDLATKQLSAVDEGRGVRFIDWAGDTLVYTVSERLPSATVTTERLASLEVANKTRHDLANAPSFGAVRVAVQSVAYIKQGGELRVVNLKGGGDKNLASSISQIAQPDADRLAFQSAGAWQEFNANTSSIKNAAAPSNGTRAFLASSSPGDGQSRVFIEQQADKLVIFAKNVATGKEKQLHTSPTIRGPIYWVGNVLVFRDSAQNADFALGLSGVPKKVSDVTPSTSGFVPPPSYISLF